MARLTRGIRSMAFSRPNWSGNRLAVGHHWSFCVTMSREDCAARSIVVSIEVSMDYPSFAEDLAASFMDAKDTLEAAAFATGSGSGEPNGIVTAVAAVTASRVAATTNNSYALEDVYATIEDLPARHRPGASWAASLPIINLTRQFATSSNYATFLTDLTGDSPAKLLGKPLYEVSNMDAAITTGDDDILLVGDFSRYVIVDRVGMSIEFIPHLFATANNLPSGQRGYFGFWRVGADVSDVNAFRILRI